MSKSEQNVSTKTEQSLERTIIGKVTSSKMNKTAVVSVVTKKAHPVYGKFVSKTTKYYVHDEKNVLKEGDVVRIKQSRPLSKLKRWVLTEVVEECATV